METSQLQARLDDASILAPCLGRVGMMMTTLISDNGNGIGTEYYGITTMRRLRKGYERLSRHNQQSELFYTSIQEYWLCAMTTGSEHCVSSPVKDLPK
jgi:hypothetical protein